MRKFTATLLLSLLVLAASAQKGFVPKLTLSKAQNENLEYIKKTTAPPRPQSIIWEHHFDGELWSGTSVDGVAVPEEAPEGWSLTDATGNDFYWRWDTVGPRGNFTSPGADCHEPQVPLISETAHNGFMMLEANYYNTPDDCEGILEEPMNAAVVYEEGIDFSGYEAVRLQFTQWSYTCCNAFDEETGLFFEISTDNGATWISKLVFLASLGSGNVNTGDIDEVDITEMVAGESNVQFRFRFVNLTHYHWEIDDVYFVEPYAYDLKALDYWNNYIDDYYGDGYIPGYEDEHDFIEGYYNYPWFMIQNFASYSMEVLNYGYAQQTGVMHHVDITKNGVLVNSFSSEMPNLISMESDTSKTVGNFMPDGKGHYTLYHYFTADNQDQDPTNDTLSRDFVVGNNILSAVDYKHRDGSVMPSNWNGHIDGRGLGTRFNLPPTSDHGDGTADYYVVEGLEFYLTSQRYSEQLALIENGGASMYAELYRFDETAEQWVLVISSDEYTLQISDTASFVYIPYATDGSSEYLTEEGTYMTNLAFYGLWTDPFDRDQSVYVGENMSQKVAYGATMLVDPGAAGDDGVSNPSGGAGACIALHLGFSDPYPETEYETTFYVTSNGTPYEGATVTVAGVEVDTDADGNAVYMLEDGDYPFTIDAEILGEDEEPIKGEFTVSGAGQTIPVEITSIFTVSTVDFNIYPNPSNGVFNIDVDGNATVTVMNVAGQVIDSRTISGSQAITLDNVNTGVYFVRVQVGENVGTKQLIIR